MTEGIRSSPTDSEQAMLTLPRTSPFNCSIYEPTDARSDRFRLIAPMRISPAAVRRTPYGRRSSSGVPRSRSTSMIFLLIAIEATLIASAPPRIEPARVDEGGHRDRSAEIDPLVISALRRVAFPERRDTDVLGDQPGVAQHAILPVTCVEGTDVIDESAHVAAAYRPSTAISAGANLQRSALNLMLVTLLSARLGHNSYRPVWVTGNG